LGETAPVVREFTSTHYPNPFNPETVIYYSLPQESKVELTVYNIKGQRVNRLINSEQPAGDYRIIWNGTNERGERVSSGVYFYRLTAGDRSLNRKMLLLK
jgi:flagellar hook assembly protein FlgD